MKEFLQSRNIDGLFNTFVINRIDDAVAPQLDKNKLMELGLAYDDAVIFQQFFNIQTEKVATYQQKKNKLKKKLLRAHTGKNDTLNRPVLAPTSCNITIGIKCMGKAKKRSQYKYTLKANKSITVDFSKDATYQQIHDHARTIFQIPDSTKSFIGAYKVDTLEETFATLYHYALSQKDKKKSILLYLYYPKTYAKLEMDRLRYGFSFSDSNSSDGDLFTFEKSTEQSCLTASFNSRTESPHYDPSVSTNRELPLHQYQQTSVSGSYNAPSLPVPSPSVDFHDNQLPSFTIPPNAVSNHFESSDLLPSNAVTFTRPTSVCEKCSCTYYYFCLKCQQDEEFQTSLAIDLPKDISIHDNHQQNEKIEIPSHSTQQNDKLELPTKTSHQQDVEIEIPNQENIRMARLNHFSRLRRRPIRYRHSIGSPSLSKVNPQVKESRENVYPVTENSENKMSCSIKQNKN